MIKKMRLLAVLPLMFSFIVSAVEKNVTAAEQLAQKLTAMNTLSADFSQGNEKKTGLSEQGTMQLQRPNRFRWNVTSPFRQEIIADNARLWVVDPDFKQVVIKKQDAGPTAVQLLSGDAKHFLQDYTVVQDSRGQQVTFSLTPRKPSELFDSLEIRFSKGLLATITIVDALGGKRQIEFTRVKTNQPIAGNVFEPDLSQLKKAGYDIIDETAL